MRLERKLQRLGAKFTDATDEHVASATKAPGR